MKKICIMLAVVSLLVQSCTEDKGNYDYVAINEVSFGGINDEYTVMTNSTILDIHPEVTMSEGVSPDDARFQYEWVCVAPGGDRLSLIHI